MKGFPILISICVLLLCACSGGSDTPDPDITQTNPDEGPGDMGTAIDEGTPAPEPKTYTMITLNAGLAYGYVPYSEQRREQVMAAIGELDADVLCLQEVWTEEDRDQVAATLEGKGYTAHVYVTTGAPSQGCTEEEAQPLVDCSNDNGCTELPGSEFTDCVLANCGAAIGQVSQGCLGCLANDLTRSLEDMQTNCIGVEEVNSWAYDGHNGLVMATKSPDTVFEGKDFEASLTWRSYITATSPSMAESVPAIDSITCTHLTSFLGNVPYIGPFAGYEEENAQEIDVLLAAMPEGNHVIMGDLNTGPENTDTGISSELPDNFSKFTDTNWLPSNVDNCTWCPPENNLLSDTSAMHNIDHILLNESLAAAVTPSITILWKAPITIVDTENNEIDAHLSDHFGVRVELTPVLE